MSDFATQFKAFNDTLGQAAKGVYNKIDQWSFKMLVDCLKSNDFDVVSEAVDQLVKEKRPLGIAPLFFVANAHPNMHVRKKAQQGLSQFGKDEEIAEVTSNKPVDEATKLLIQKYGNYKS